MKSNLMDQEAAKAAAKRLYQKINFSGGPLQSYEVSSLLTDTYEFLKIRTFLFTQPSNPLPAILKHTHKFWTPTGMGRLLLPILKLLQFNIYVGQEYWLHNLLTPLLTSRSLRCPGFLVNPTTTLTVAV
jgi:hypothetical protein